MRAHVHGVTRITVGLMELVYNQNKTIMFFITAKRRKELEDSTNKASSMRHSMLRVLDLITVSVIVMLGIFAYNAYKDQPIDYSGAAWFLGGLATLFGVASGSKVWQAYTENKDGRSN